MQPQARPHFHSVRPILPFHILREIHVEQRLCERIAPGTERTPSALLRINQPVLVEAADINTVGSGLVKITGRMVTQQAPESFRNINTASVIRDGGPYIASARQIAH